MKWGPPFQNGTPSDADQRERENRREAARQVPVSPALQQLLLLLPAAAAAAAAA